MVTLEKVRKKIPFLTGLFEKGGQGDTPLGLHPPLGERGGHSHSHIKSMAVQYPYLSRKIRVRGDKRSKNSAIKGANSSCQHSGPS
jgi:hypothetical protein